MVQKDQVMQWQNYTCQSRTSGNQPYCNSKWKTGKCDVSRICRSKMDFPTQNIKCETAWAWLEGLLNFFQLCLKKSETGSIKKCN